MESARIDRNVATSLTAEVRGHRPDLVPAVWADLGRCVKYRRRTTASASDDYFRSVSHVQSTNAAEYEDVEFPLGASRWIAIETGDVTIAAGNCILNVAEYD